MTRALLAAAAALLVAAPGASAQSGIVVAPEAGLPQTSAVLADGRVAWAQSSDDLTTRLFAARLGLWTPAALATAKPLPRADTVGAAIAATASSALLATAHARCDERCKDGGERLGVRILAGPWNALRPVAAGPEDPAGHPTLAGDRVAYRVPTADGGLAVRLLDPVSGERTDVPVEPNRFARWAVAGDLLVAQRPGGEWVVTNWRTGADLYRPRFPADWRSVWSVQLTPDGSALWDLVVDRGPFGAQVPAVSTPEAPEARELTRPGTVHALANRRLLASEPSPATGARITDLEERDVATVTRAGDMGFDGSRLAWVERPCAVPIAVVWDAVAGDPRPAVPEPLCPGARSIRRPAVRGGALRVRLRCAGTPTTGCPVRVAVTVRHPRRAVRRSLATVALSAGERRTLRMPTSPRGIPRGRLRITVVTEPSQRPAPGERRVVRYRVKVR